jgi:hypothetical protein
MVLNMIILEVDGTLANPRVQVAVGVWSLVLILASSRFAILRSRGRKRFPMLVILLSFATPVAQHFIGLALYKIEDPDIISVGFWGGPPVWIAPMMGIAAAVATFLVARRNRAGTRGQGPHK